MYLNKQPKHTLSEGSERSISLKENGLESIIFNSNMVIEHITSFDLEKEFAENQSENICDKRADEYEKKLKEYQQNKSSDLSRQIEEIRKKIKSRQQEICKFPDKELSRIVKFEWSQSEQKKLDRKLKKLHQLFDKNYSKGLEDKNLKAKYALEFLQLRKQEEKRPKEAKAISDRLNSELDYFNTLVTINFAELNHFELFFLPIFNLFNQWKYQHPDNPLSLFNETKISLAYFFLSADQYKKLWSTYSLLRKTEREWVDYFYEGKKLRQQMQEIHDYIRELENDIEEKIEKLKIIEKNIKNTETKIKQLCNQQMQILNNVEKIMKQQVSQQARAVSDLQKELKELKKQYDQPDQEEIKLQAEISKKKKKLTSNPWIEKIQTDINLIKDIIERNKKYLGRAGLDEYFQTFRLRNLHNGKGLQVLPTYRRYEKMDFGETEAQIRALEKYCHTLEIWLCLNLIIQLHLQENNTNPEIINPQIQQIQKTNQKIIRQYDRGMRFINEIINSKVKSTTLITYANGVLAEILYQIQLTAYIWFDKKADKIAIRSANLKEEKKCMDIIFSFPYGRYKSYDLPLQLTTMNSENLRYEEKISRTHGSGVALLTIGQPRQILEDINQRQYDQSLIRTIEQEIKLPPKKNKKNDYLYLFRILVE